MGVLNTLLIVRVYEDSHQDLPDLFRLLYLMNVYGDYPSLYTVHKYLNLSWCHRKY